jgi:phage terminase large subunit-like protein
VSLLTDRPWEQLSDAERAILSGEIDEIRKDLTPEAEEYLAFYWDFWRRPNQGRPAGMGKEYRIWMLLAGRGFGKSRVGAEETRKQIELCERVALVGPTAADVRDVMVEGESGLLSVFPPSQRPDYEPSKRRVTFHNGAIATLFSAEEPDRLRGPQHEWAWIDEPASMPRGDEALSNLLLGLRLGDKPWVLITGTPKRIGWLRALSERADTKVTRGSTYDNVANLAPGFVEDILGRYEGTRLGRQELHAEWLDDVEGALWTMGMIDAGRIHPFDLAKPWGSLNAWLTAGGQSAILDRRAWRTIVAVDPPGETAECGIVVACAPTQGQAGRDHAVVLEDASTVGRPEEWGARVAQTARRWNAERVVVEGNQGGDMVRATIHAVDPDLRVEKITAKVSKAARAEPVSALYERRFVHHAGFFPMLEAQMTTWVPGDAKSPDRMDALVHAISTLLQESARVRATVKSPSLRRIDR